MYSLGIPYAFLKNSLSIPSLDILGIPSVFLKYALGIHQEYLRNIYVIPRGMLKEYLWNT